MLPIYRVIDDNLRAAMRCYGRVGPRSEIVETAGLSIASSGLDFGVFNSAMLLSPPEPGGLAKAIAAARLHFSVRSLGWTFWLCDDVLPQEDRYRAREIFRQNGMSSIAQPPGMYAERLAVPRGACPDLEFRRVADKASRRDFALLSSVIFSLPLEVAAHIYGSESLWQEPMTGWVAYSDGNPVAIVSIVVSAGVAGVYSLGTVLEHRGRGCAPSLLRYALQVAREETGIESSVLQTTSQGMKLYLRLGYRVAASFSVYMEEGCRRV